MAKAKSSVTKEKTKWGLVLLRVAMGWLFLYAGWSKLTTPGGWSAVGFLTHAANFGDFFAWFATPANIGWVNFLNVWGQILIGTSLITGVMVKTSAKFGILMMILYYLPDLNFPYVGEHSIIVEEHFIYALVLLTLIKADAGKYVGLDSWFKSLGFVKNSMLKQL